MVTPKTNTQLLLLQQIVGHLPKEIAKICFRIYFIADRGTITGEVMDKCRRTKEVCGEMEVPSVFTEVLSTPDRQK